MMKRPVPVLLLDLTEGRGPWRELHAIKSGPSKAGMLAGEPNGNVK